MAKKPTALIILDGFANRESEHGNAVKLANKPNFDRYYNKYPTTQIEASGLDVGLPEGQMGNSEVGHVNSRVQLHYLKHHFQRNHRLQLIY